jgi:hypothetical protein
MVQGLAAAVFSELAALEQRGVDEAGEQLRDRPAGDAGAQRQLGA